MNEFEFRIESYTKMLFVLSKRNAESKLVVFTTLWTEDSGETSGSHHSKSEKPCAIMLKLIGLPISCV